ncbi:MAG TPA: TolC family protein [Gemmatimonadota bacterium]|nr:TolC family protein [Gemmatimonadota bacterium]
MRTRIPTVVAAAIALAAAVVQPLPGRAQEGPGPALELRLEEVYALAAERNPRIAASAALADASAIMVSSAGRPPDPVFQIGAMNLRLPEFEADMEASMAPAIQLMQMVPFPGKLGLSERIARGTSEMARANAEETAWMIRTDVAMAFYDLYAADRQNEVMRRTLRILEDFEKVARAMYGAGTGRQSDVLRANVEIARMEAEIARMDAMREVAAARLNGLLVRPAETPVASPVFPDLPAGIPARDTLRTWAEETRPMLLEARTGVERAGAARDLARRELWPDLTLGVQYGQRDAGMGLERMGSFMVGFSLPVFAGSRQLRMRDEAAAMERMSLADLSETRAGVDARIGELLAELNRARTLIDLYESTVIPQAEANVESSYSSYRVGSVDFMTLVDARMTVNQYEQEYHELLADYGVGVAELEAVVGRELPSGAGLLAEVR